MNRSQKDNLVKHCIDCNTELIVGINWNKYNHEHGKYLCKDCISKRNRKRWNTLSQDDNYLKKKRDYNREHWNDIKFKKDTHKIITYFICSSGKMCCELCGENDIDVLEIDHINGCGNQHRQKLRYPLDQYLYTNNFPNINEYRILCKNCNWKEYLRKNNKFTYQ